MFPTGSHPGLMPSPRARRLAEEVSRTIHEARAQDPDLTWREVRQALWLAARAEGRTPAAPVLLGLGLLAGALVVMAVLLMRRTGRTAGTQEVWVGLGLVALVALLVGALFFARRRRGK